MASLTVLLCNYNHGKYIGRSIEAVLSQSRQPDQYLILDDGSTDDSVEIIKRYAALNSHIHFIRKEKNEGLLQGIKDITEKVEGDFIFWSSSDDYILPGFFESAMRVADSNNGVGIIFGNVEILDQEEKKLKTLKPPLWTFEKTISKEDYINQYLMLDDGHSVPASATLFNTKHWKENGYFHYDLNVWGVAFTFHSLAIKNGAVYVPSEWAVFICKNSSVSGILHRNSVELLKLIIRYKKRMRSQEYQAVFPKSYIHHWIEHNVKMVTEPMEGEIWERQRQRREIIFGSERAPFFWRWIDFIERKMTKLFWGLFLRQ